MEKDLTKEGDVYKTQTGEICEQVQEKNYVFKVDESLRERVKNWSQSGAVSPIGSQKKVLEDVEK